MQLVPMRSAFHLSLLGTGAMLVGVASAHAGVTLLGGALVLGVAFARALAKWGALRSRMSGFEMTWDERRRLIPVIRLRAFELGVILTNRDARALEFSNLELIHAPGLRAEVLPRTGVIARGASVRVQVRIVPECVGPLGVFGLSLKTTRPPGLFETPLVFANPLVVLVSPDSDLRHLAPGRVAVKVAGTRRAFRARDALDFRELREHRAGDPFRRIAWKPSARRGKLLVMETEQQSDSDHWVLLDASCEMSLGPSGHSRRERSLDHVASLIRARLERGERVGFLAYASRELVRIPPEPGHRQWLRVRAALTEAIHTADADRSALGVLELEELAFEHARSLDPTFPQKWSRDESERLALVSELAASGPYRSSPLLAPSVLERALREYIRSFGIASPPSDRSERRASEQRLAAVLGEKGFRGRASGDITIVGRPPNSQSPAELWTAMERLSRRGARLCFHAVPDLGAELGADAPPDALVLGALRARQKASLRATRRLLARHRIGVVSVPDQPRPRE